MDITEALCHFLNLTFCPPTKNIFNKEIVAYVVEGGEPRCVVELFSRYKNSQGTLTKGEG